MKLKTMLAVATLLLMIGLSSAAAYADTLNFTLTNPVQSVYKGLGGTLTFEATVFNPTSSTVFLNGDDFSLAGFGVDDSGFWNNFPLSLGAGASFTGNLFKVTVPASASLGTYVGSFTLLGGADDLAGNTLATASFAVNVVPEPSSIMLLISGVAGLARFRGKLR